MAIRRHGSALGTISTKSRSAFRRLLVLEPLEERTLLSGNPVAVNDTYTLNQGQTLNVSSPASTSLSVVSQPGDFVGQGRTYFYTAENAGIGSSFALGITPLGQMAGFVVKPFDDLNGQGWFGQMWASPGTVLTPGFYPDVVSAGIPSALRNGHPALLISFDNRSANDVTGNFTILEVAFDALGELQSLDATFEQHAEGMTPALLGEIKYKDHTEDVGVLDNDTDSDKSPLTANLTSAPAHGTLNLASDGTFTYTPDAGFSGVDSFTYIANDGTADSNVATVNLNVNPVSLHLTSIPSTTAGIDQNFTVDAEDASGNTLTNYAGTVAFSSSDVQAGLPATYAFGTADQGVHTFSVTLKTAGSQNITVQDAVNGLTTGQTGILVSAAAASKLSLSGLPAGATAGAKLEFSITAFDPFNNIADSFGDAVHFSSTDGHAALPVDYTFAPADHGMHVFSATLKTAGNQSITVQDGGTGLSAGPVGITVNASAASSLSVIGLPASATAGTNLQFSITAFDPFGNVAVAFADTIQFSSGDNQAALPTAYSFTAADHGTHLFSATFKTAGNQSLVGQDAANGLISCQTGILVSAAAASRLALSGLPASATAGANLLFSLTAFDPFNNIADSFGGTVHFSSDDSQAALPVAYLFTAADHGTHVFSATLKTAGSQNVTALDAGNSLTTGQTGILVSAAAASRLALSGLPASATAGANLQFSLTALDPFNNIADSFGDTVHFSSSDARATLPANYTFSAADRGSYQFSASQMTAGAETLTVTDASASSVASAQASLVVNAGPTAKFVITILSATIAGVPLSPVINAFDAEDNPTPSYTGTIHFSSTDPKAVLPGDYTFLASDQGRKTFSGVTLETAGAWSFTVTDLGNAAVTASRSGIGVSSGQPPPVSSPAITRPKPLPAWLRVSR